MEHVVLLKKTPALADTKAKEHVAAAVSLLQGIPCVVSASGGPAVDEARTQGFTHVIVVRLQSSSDLNVFTKHRLNKQAVKKHIVPIVGPGSVSEKYSRMIKIDARCDTKVCLPEDNSMGVGAGFLAGVVVSIGVLACYSALAGKLRTNFSR